MPHVYGSSATAQSKYTAKRAAGPIKIDGKLDEPSWKLAQKSTRFVDLVTGQPVEHDTRAAVLWDDDYLYVGFWVEEPDVRGTLTERDSFIWNDNDVEVFIDGGDTYYEFEMNSLGTVLEIFWIWKDVYKRGGKFDIPEFDLFGGNVWVLNGLDGRKHPRGARWGFLDWDMKGLKTAIHIDGTLNKRDDTDKGWTAEIAFPWKSMKWLANGRSLPPKEGDVWRIDFSRFQQYDKETKPLPSWVVKDSPGWVWNMHGLYDSHIPECFVQVSFSEKSVGK
ncbi:MAG: polyhydroxyalkanoate depolymerase [SAR202 cluster bacterium]|nr:polyhydroxyalkanoate depolymerase [SAR202 cluster bacterium]